MRIACLLMAGFSVASPIARLPSLRVNSFASSLAPSSPSLPSPSSSSSRIRSSSLVDRASDLALASEALQGGSHGGTTTQHTSTRAHISFKLGK